MVLYELLTGEKPFSGPPHAVLAKVADSQFEPPTPRSHDATISKDLEAICQRAMAKDATNRYADMQALADDLDRWLEGKPTDARPLGPHERAARWCRRNPALAGSGAALSLGLLIIMGLVWKLATADTSPVIVQAAPALTSDPALDLSERQNDAPESSSDTEPTVSFASSTPTATPLPPAPPALPWQPTPEQQAFFDEVAALPVEEQAATVAKKLQEVNPGFDGEFKQKIIDGRVIEFTVSTGELKELWPVRGLHDLNVLQNFGGSSGVGKLRDISVLAGWRLRILKLERQSIDDLSPLAGMPLENLSVAYNPQLSDLSPIRGMPLKELRCNGTSIENLMDLRGMQLTLFECARTPVHDLGPLEGMPITQLYIYESHAADLSPLKGVPMRRLAVTPSVFSKSYEQCFRSLPAQDIGESWNTCRPAKDYWESFESRQREAEEFVKSISTLTATDRAQQIETKIQQINNVAEIELDVNFDGNNILDLAILRLSWNVRDIWPMRGLGDLKRLTISDGPNWLDLSPINNLPIEELICRQDQAMRNRLMLAAMETLKTINGQPADQYLAYLKSLSESQSAPPTAPITIPTEEEILAAHPPLDQWLEGREILTVAQDGSAMFTSIQAALDTQQNGQVVEVLDKGPYSEPLRWRAKDTCGLVSKINTVIQTDLQRDDSINDVSAIHVFDNLKDCRLSGFIFVSQTSDPKKTKLLSEKLSRNTCIEACCFLKSVTGNLPLSEKDSYFHTDIDIDIGVDFGNSPALTSIRENVFSIPALLSSKHSTRSSSRNEVSESLVLQRNWFFVPLLKSIGLSESFNVTSSKQSQPIAAVLSNNVINTVSGHYPGITSSSWGIYGTFDSNTLTSLKGLVFRSNHAASKQFSILNNLSVAPFATCFFWGDDSELAFRVAERNWPIDRNISISEQNARLGHLPLSQNVSTPFRLLSTDPLDRDFMRVDPLSIKVPEGDPFPGALPPGPAPPEGDWFTRLQERFEDALQHLPAEEREKWTRPIELPKFTPPAENVAAANPSVADTAAAPEPMQAAATSETSPVAEPTVGFRLDGRNISFLQYDGPQPHRWVEVDGQGKLKYSFEETRRTDRYVIIIDRTRSMSIRIPLVGGRVFYSTDGEEKWFNLGTFQRPPSTEELAEQQRQQKETPVAANEVDAPEDANMPDAQPAPTAGNVAGNAQAERLDRVQLPQEMRDLLRLPGMSEKMTLLERDYLRYKRGFFVFGRVSSQNPQIDPRLIEARMPVGQGGHFIDLVADAGRPIGFVLHGHAYKSVVPTGPPDGHQGPYAENLGNLVMTPLRSVETHSTTLQVERMDVKGRRLPVPVNFKIITAIPELNYFTETTVPRQPGDLEGFSIKGQTLPNGKFALKGLSPLPTKYKLQINVPGHLPLDETLRLNSSSETFVLEEKIPLKIETIVWKDDKFDIASLKEAWLSGGDRWQFDMPKPVPQPPGTAPMGGMAGMGGLSPFKNGTGGYIQQANRGLTFALSGLSTSAKDLGPGTLQEFLDQDPRKAIAYHDRDYRITLGHVYLLRSYHTVGMGYVPGRESKYELEHSDYALVRVTSQN